MLAKTHSVCNPRPPTKETPGMPIRFRDLGGSFTTDCSMSRLLGRFGGHLCVGCVCVPTRRLARQGGRRPHHGRHPHALQGPEG